MVGAPAEDTRLNDPTRDQFDEAGYLRRNPGLLDAIVAGIVDSGWDHYDKHGRREGRLPNDVDPDFYLGAYPAMEIDLGRRPVIGDAADHFMRFGRARGYRPNAGAPAPDGPERGWTDRADALDLIRNRFDLGRITDRQAERLRCWVRDGYAIVDLGTATDRLVPAALALEQVFAGVTDGALFACPALGAGPRAWVPELTPHPSAVLDIHYLSRAVRALILAHPVARFLTELFDGPVLIAASTGVLRPLVQDAPCQGVGLWFGLDDPLMGGTLGKEQRPVAPPHGSVVVWRSDLVFEPAGVSGLAVNRGIRAWVCPRLAALSGITSRVWGHEGHWFASGVYAEREPVD